MLFTNIFLYVGLPAGSFNNIKLFFLASLVLLMFLMAKNIRLSRFMIITAIIMVISVSASLLYVNLANRFEVDALTEYRSFLLMILIISILHSLHKSNIFAHMELARILIASASFYIVLKIAMIVLVFMSPANLDIINTFISEDMTPMGSLGMAGLERLYSINDYLIPFLYFYIDRINISRTTATLVKALFIISIVLSMTRYIWVAFTALLALNLLLNRQFRSIVISSLFLLILLVVVNEFTQIKIIDAIINRTGEEGSLSVSVKKEQIFYLYREIADYPLFGKGIGTYVEDYIRNERLKYGYEVFALLIFMQFGVLGAMSLAVLMIAPFIRWISASNFRLSKKMLFAFVALLIYLTSSFTNPVILSVTSAFLLSFLYLDGLVAFNSARNRRIAAAG